MTTQYYTHTRINVNSYQINDTSEECNCQNCGMPLYVNDWVYATDEGGVFCGIECTETDQWIHMHVLERGSGCAEFVVIMALLALVVYVLLSWSFGTGNVNQWGYIMTHGTTPIVAGIRDLLTRINMLIGL